MSEEKTAKKMLQELQAANYEEIRQAARDGEPIGYCVANFQKEIFMSMGLKVLFPENHSATVAAKKLADPCLEEATSRGYSDDLCSYARISIGYCLSGIEIGKGVDMPRPDYMLLGNTVCNTCNHWYENLAWEYGIPCIFVDAPFNTGPTVVEHKQEYVVRQLEEVIRQLEIITGKKFDYEKFRETMKISDENGRLYRRGLDLLGQAPAPANGHDAMNFMSIMVTMKGDPRATVVLKKWVSELEEKANAHTTSFKGEEKYRLLFDGITCWPHLRYCSDAMLDKGINMIALPYTDLFCQTFQDIRKWCNNYSSVTTNASMDMWKDQRKRLVKDYHCDCMLGCITRSCKPMVGKQQEISRMIQKECGIPTALFDGDQSDPAAFNKAQFDTRLQALVEIMEDRKKEA